MRATQRAEKAGRPVRLLAWGRARLYWPWLLVAGGWVVVVLATLADDHQLVDHHYLLEDSQLPWITALAVFLASWLVMSLAMMLPSSLPILRTTTRQAGAWPWPAHAVFLASYLLVWSGFAAAAFVGDTLVHWLVNHGTWLSARPALIGATTLAVAGAFQFTPLKRSCLLACQRLGGHPYGHPCGDRRIGAGAAWRLGLHHGACCLGSGWALMLVLFGVGMGGLAWMAALTGVMVVEKAVPGGRRLTPFVGGALLLMAAAWWSQPAWLPIGAL